MVEITPILDNKSSIPLYIQLSNYIKQEIGAGRIQPNEKLPSKRKLAKYLELSLNTIQAAYDQLRAEGYVESKLRKGIFVVRLEEEVLPNQLSPQTAPTKKEQKWININIDFNSGKVDLEHFPYVIWRKLTIQSLYEDQSEYFNIGDSKGELSLREEIAKYLFFSRGVKCSADQIVIGAGTQILIHLLCLLIGKEHVYAMEEPGFHRTRAAFQDLGVMLHSISLDEDGMEINQLKNSEATVAYVTPSHQFPLGMVMPISRRIELLKWATEVGGYIIEDDYDSEFRYKGKPIPSLQGLDSNGNVIYLGTFSKSLIPSIRISYLVLPPELSQKYEEHFSIYKQTASRLHQETLFRFMNEGHWYNHLNKMRTLYRKKQHTFIEAIKVHLGEHVNIIGEKSGLHLVLEVNNGMTEAELTSSAMAIGVKVYPLSIYFANSIDNRKPKILLGFGGLSELEIHSGIQLLAKAWLI
ncbi:PLP-dependent aminotransferase family protein [Bacillus sp. Bva_UNVM-123]|uniref:MocR-like pyridoxine biosynthesis transcription factor PdxR n=1 Tax=Bacillus sp. Bva_UNVM-123 TaxID=2829798 RepID=UPI00391FA342